MYIPFEQLSDTARIWVYQANRPFTQGEQAVLLPKTQKFLQTWETHGHPLSCSVALHYDQFLILAVEEKIQSATGCAVDSSVQFIRALEQAFQVNLLDRTHIAFMHNTRIFLIQLDQLPHAIKQGTVCADMLTFDNTITKKGELTHKWMVRAQDTWLDKYFH